MRIGRRTFILGTGLAAAAPAFAELFALARTYASPPPASPEESIVFRIDGWSVRDDVTPDDAPSKSDEMWISVNQSWRTAWR